MITFLDGALGTELDLRGVKTDSRAWSTPALLTDPDVVQQIHREYAQAGATVHTTNTFRTQKRTIGDRWEELTRLAVDLARSSVPTDHRIAGSIAPLEDCYQPELSPDHPAAEHREMAECLADADCDLLLVETFAHIDEAAIAVSEAVRTGKETWLSLTAGPSGDLLTPDEMAEGARRAVDRGAHAILVNCVAATDTRRCLCQRGRLRRSYRLAAG
jgi:S-methylmethionine-dependent homocysteine/selenocysteine methylase